MLDSRSEHSVARIALGSFSRGDTVILKDIHLDIARGETLALVGPSGIGKTTLLRILAGLEDDFDGTKDVPDTVAVVFQEPALLPWRSLTDNICLPTGATRDQAQAALRDVGLDGRGGDFPGQLSLGQQRRVALARAFCAEPQLLLLDEPFVSLDADLVQEMMDLFLRLRDKHRVATLFVTHSEAEAQYLADRRVRLEGSPATVAAPDGSPLP